MRTAALHISLIIGALVSGCGEGAVAPAAEKKVAEKPEAAKPEVKPEAAAPEAAKPEPIHFDITHDKSGVLARAASTLQTSEAISSPALREHLGSVSHHAEKTPSNEALCKHMASLMGATAPPQTDCMHALEHQRVHVGPEIFAEVAQCVTAAKTLDTLMLCEDAEKEAEKLLHEKKHGDGVEPETCTKLFTHFEKLAMADAGEQSIAVEEILEEVRADVLEACAEQGTRAEVECALNAKDMAALGACESEIL